MIIVDRIEKDLAVCEFDGEFLNIPLESISGNINEGVVLTKNGNRYIVDEDKTNSRKKEMFEKQKRLFSK